MKTIEELILSQNREDLSSFLAAFLDVRKKPQRLYPEDLRKRYASEIIGSSFFHQLIEGLDDGTDEKGTSLILTHRGMCYLNANGYDILLE